MSKNSKDQTGDGANPPKDPGIAEAGRSSNPGGSTNLDSSTGKSKKNKVDSGGGGISGSGTPGGDFNFGK